MDIYDPQTLGIMVFGGFMVISAVGIALVSTFSMKETSYEEALAKQRRELGTIQPVRTEKKKKDKISEKKNRGKKKEEKINGKIPEPEKNEETPEVHIVTEPSDAPLVEASPVPEPTPTSEVMPSLTQEPAETQLSAEPSPGISDPSPAPSPKEKKKKKLAKIEPAQSALVAASASAKVTAVPASAQAPESISVKPVGPPSASGSTKATSSKPASAIAKTAPSTTPVTTKSIPASAKSAAPPAKTAPAAAKAVSAPSKSSAPPAKPTQAPSKSTLVFEAVTKDVPVMAVPPVGSQQANATTGKAQEPKKKASKKKTETAAPVESADTPLYLPYKSLVSTIRSMVFSEGEAHRLIEILSEKAGIIQDTWHMATQKGDPVAMLKKQLEEREKQLAAEQEDASAAKNRLRELSKELAAEKSKVASVETRLSSQLSKREQEMIALQARMQASYQDHVDQTQKLNAKILSLQDQLENGPNAQLARLQQENSILRDALNQATSQAESKQNAELAKLRQECAKLTKELGEKTESVLADEHIRKGLEAKVSATEKQLSQQQASNMESEQTLQRKLEEVCEELRVTQSRNSSLQESLNKVQQDNNTLSEFQMRVETLENEIVEHTARADTLTAQLEETQTEKSKLLQQIASINSLLEANQNKKEDDQVDPLELEQLKLGLHERDNQLNALHEELKMLQMVKETAENKITELEQRNKSEDVNFIEALQEELKTLKEEMVQLKNKPESHISIEQLQNSLTEKAVLVEKLQDELKAARENSAIEESIVTKLTAFQSEARETLQALFPLIPLETEQPNWSHIFTQKAQEALSQQSQESDSNKTSSELLQKLKETEDNYASLQAECDQYRTVLAETEGMLKHLQKSVEEEELVWKSKIANSEEQLKSALEKVDKLETETQSIDQLKEQMMLLEAQLEKQSDNLGNVEEMEQLSLQLAQSQSQLELALKEAKESKEELAEVREQLGEITMRGQREQNGPTEAQSSQVQYQLNQTADKLLGEAAEKQQLSEELEQAQATVTELQAQLDLLKVSAESPHSDTEDVAQLKERLEKEKKLSKDLGQAATKLQQLLKATQDQLTKEKDTVRTLQEHLEGKGEFVELKEGTSV